MLRAQDDLNVTHHGQFAGGIQNSFSGVLLAHPNGMVPINMRPSVVERTTSDALSRVWIHKVWVSSPAEVFPGVTSFQIGVSFCLIHPHSMC